MGRKEGLDGSGGAIFWASFVRGILLSGSLCLGVACSSAHDGEDLHYVDVEAIFFEKCLRCHDSPTENGAPPNMILSTYEEVYERRSSVEQKVRGGDMPPLWLELSPAVESLSSQEREELLTWLDAGAPE